MSEMNQGIEMLLARMDSHPDEFKPNVFKGGDYGRWTTEIIEVLGKTTEFSEEERDAVRTKVTKLRREEFTQHVMKKLINGPEEPTPDMQVMRNSVEAYIEAKKQRVQLNMTQAELEAAKSKLGTEYRSIWEDAALDIIQRLS